MAFSFECPHCEMGFEAEFELCGSTCTCPGCGGLFLVPEVDPAALEAAQSGAQAVAGGPPVGLAEGSGDVGGLELARLRTEAVEAEAKLQNLEGQLAEEKARASRADTLAEDLREAIRAQQKAESRTKDQEKRIHALQDQLQRAESKLKQVEEASALQKREWETTSEQLRTDFAAAQQAAERAKQALEQPSQEVARLRGELETAEARGRVLQEEISREREKTGAQVAGLREALEKADAERTLRAAQLEKLELAGKSAEEAQRKLVREAGQSRASLEETVRKHTAETAAFRKSLADAEVKIQEFEKEKDGARKVFEREVGALQKQLAEHKAESARAALAAAEAGKETERLRAELSGVKAEKWSAERGFAEEHQRLLEQLRSVELERDTIREDSRLLARAAAEPDGEVERLRSDLAGALASGVKAERTFGQERDKLAGKLEILEQANEAAGERARSLLEEMSHLRRQLEFASKTLEAQKTEAKPSAGLSAEAEAELRQVLAKRDQEIQRLAAQIRDTTQSAAAGSPPDSFGGWMIGKRLVAFPVLALIVGLLVGAAIVRPKAVPLPESEVALKSPTLPGVDSPGETPEAQGSPGSVAQVVSPVVSGVRVAHPVVSSGSAAVATPPQSTAAVGTLAASRAGMPSPLPDQFLGIRFGTDLGEVAGIAQWKETAGKRHRKAELLGSEVEAVLTADVQNRLIMGSYVRVASRQPDALTPFLEWAVNVQDAVSALYGEPIRVHSVDGATDAVEVVRKIAAGEDFYQATWEREAEDGMIDLSIRVFNERSVVFRMEYRARQLYSGFVEGQAAKDGAKDSPKEGAKEGAN